MKAALRILRIHTKQLIRTDSGVSLIDLMVSLVIAASLMAIALPGQSALHDSFNRGTALKQLQGDLRRARSEAVGSGTRTVLSIAPDGSTYEVGFDYQPYNSPPAMDIVTFRGILPNKITLASSIPIVFDPRGYAIDDSGANTQVTVELKEDGSTYTTGTIYAAGFMIF